MPVYVLGAGPRGMWEIDPRQTRQMHSLEPARHTSAESLTGIKCFMICLFVCFAAEIL